MPSSRRRNHAISRPSTPCPLTPQHQQRYPYIPPGPCIDANGQPTPILTKDVGYTPRRSSQNRHNRIRENIYANYGPLSPNPIKGFGVFLSAANAKHHSIQKYLLAAGISKVSRLYHQYHKAWKKWYRGWLVLEKGDTDLTEAERIYIIRLEEELTADLLKANPCLLNMCYQANDRVLKIVQDDIMGIGELGTNLDPLRTQFCRVYTAYEWLQRMFTDIRALPNDLWKCLMREESQKSEDWRRLMRKHYSVAKRAEKPLEDVQDGINFKFRSRKRYAHWDPKGFEHSEERGGQVLARTETVWA
ncbi:MAG: hypothetical protein Q9225_002961 [Loekoesia sp. 1 TL-2023]